MAGYKIALANEFVPIAQESYRANMDPSTIIDPRGIKEVTASSILEATGLEEGELDVFDGSPPCQAFSIAGKRAKGWGSDRTYEHGASQKNEDLFQEYIRMLDGLKPKVFVAENVSGLIKGVAKGFFLEILAALKACGYRVEARVLDAQWLGVPQMRQRLIFVGVRNDLRMNPVFPKPLPYQYTVRDALPWIALLRSTSSLDNISSTIMASGARTSGLDETATERRKFTIEELKRICAFPDDFILKGTYSQQWERLGNAVPPMMMYHIAKTIRDDILMRLPENV